MSTPTQYTVGPLTEQADGSRRDDFGNYFRKPGQATTRASFNAPQWGASDASEEKPSLIPQEKRGPQFV